MSASWIIVGVAVAGFVLLLPLNPGTDSDDDWSADARSQPATWGEAASSSIIAW